MSDSLTPEALERLEKAATNAECGEDLEEYTANQREFLAASTPEMLLALLRSYRELQSENELRKQSEMESMMLRNEWMTKHDSLAAENRIAFSNGLREAERLLRTEGVSLPIDAEETKQQRIIRFAMAFADKLDAMAGKKLPEARDGNITYID